MPVVYVLAMASILMFVELEVFEMRKLEHGDKATSGARDCYRHIFTNAEVTLSYIRLSYPLCVAPSKAKAPCRRPSAALRKCVTRN